MRFIIPSVERHTFYDYLYRKNFLYDIKIYDRGVYTCLEWEDAPFDNQTMLDEWTSFEVSQGTIGKRTIFKTSNGEFVVTPNGNFCFYSVGTASVSDRIEANTESSCRLEITDTVAELNLDMPFHPGNE